MSLNVGKYNYFGVSVFIIFSSFNINFCSTSSCFIATDLSFFFFNTFGSAAGYSCAYAKYHPYFGPRVTLGFLPSFLI